MTQKCVASVWAGLLILGAAGCTKWTPVTLAAPQAYFGDPIRVTHADGTQMTLPAPARIRGDSIIGSTTRRECFRSFDGTRNTCVDVAVPVAIPASEVVRLEVLERSGRRSVAVGLAIVGVAVAMLFAAVASSF